MDFQVSALDVQQFRHLFALSDEELADRGMHRMRVTDKPGFPCRISLRDAEVGDTVLLLNYEHLNAATPYRASHAIFVGEGVVTATQLREAMAHNHLRHDALELIEKAPLLAA